MLTQDFLIVTISIGLSGFWLFSKGIGFQFLPKIEDEKGILLPSLVFLISPFVTLYLWHFLAAEAIGEFIKPLVPLGTFLLGQTFVKWDKEKEEKQKKIELALLLVANIDGTLIRRLSILDGKLTSYGDNEYITPFKNYINESRPKIDELYDELRFKSELFKYSIGKRIFIYVEKYKDYINFIDSISIRPQDRFVELNKIRVLKIEGYVNIIDLIRELVPSTDSNYRLLDEWVVKLKLEYARLKSLEGTKKRQNLTYDIDAEREAIQIIEFFCERLNINPSLCK
ncbi:hypothetical protein H6G20_23545 [Desertifilum sp. FACHB-1129]|uniref:Uncharacterized protein n=1 Tax=Desertifilum tharense IPPAS B-1220 TaxID=1781255 RepID=A0ACD5GSZ9_9CYAN|nr:MULTISPECIES: hypothetical protein [unclassified Desertifilum]MBD2314647.1 hypothetical protein [Desertifilum sp. FACHB-1129]MBD2324934.1 hypothetical protein [Desertifilum sp. FACHB-866]MBD2335073.1 hypothetical protein [Desertifilum sp. FACHB-868]MDA0212514.1 hypothetical protein [Cyanobacteria bacterium FC1]